MDYRLRLRHIRKDRDFTQSKIGKVLNKSQQGYNHIETGRAELKIDDLKLLCDFYKLSADYLIGLSDEPKSVPIQKKPDSY
jgi:transcriptional regulator with XRE-family HTH domain